MPGPGSLARVSEIEIGRGKRGRRAYSFDDVAVVPSRRTRDPQEVSVAWQIDAYRFELPVIAAPMDSVMSPATAIAMGEAGGLGVLDLEGLWTRYDDPSDLLAHGLLDEINLLVHPIVVAEGQRLFEGTGTVPLELLSSRALPSGVLHVRYAPASGAAPASA